MNNELITAVLALDEEHAIKQIQDDYHIKRVLKGWRNMGHSITVSERDKKKRGLKVWNVIIKLEKL